jgi:hypothetical protein
MGIARHAYKLPLLILLAGLVTAPAAAEVPPLAPLTIKAKYIVEWNGITIGRINFTSEEIAGRYRMIVDTKTRGIARLFSDEASVATAEGIITEEGKYIPQRFESRPMKANDKRPHTILIYDETGKLASRQRFPDDDPAWRPPVSFDEAIGSIDPASAGLAMRCLVHKHMAQEIRESILRTYEGARLADMKVKVISRARVEYQGEYHNAINTVVTRQPIAGYTPKEKKKFAEGDPIIHLYFSADAKMLPVKVTVDSLSATLVELN